MTTDPRVTVLMSLEPVYYRLMWDGLKRHEFRRRFLAGTPVRWLVYLNPPISGLTAVIDLDAAIVDTPQRLAAIAEQARSGNGAPVHDYLADVPLGYAMPITSVREFPPVPLADLQARIPGFEQPRGFTLLHQDPGLTAIYEDFVSRRPLREMTIRHDDQAVTDAS